MPADQDRKLDQLADIRIPAQGPADPRQHDHAVPEFAARRHPRGEFPDRRPRPAGPGQPAADSRATGAEPDRVARSRGRGQRCRSSKPGSTNSTGGWPATCSKTCTASATCRRRPAITLADLPPALRERFVGQSGKWLVQAFARDGLWDIGPLEQFVKQTRTVDPEATGKPFGTLEGLQGDAVRLRPGRRLRAAGHRRGAVGRLPHDPAHAAGAGPARGRGGHHARRHGPDGRAAQPGEHDRPAADRRRRRGQRRPRAARLSRPAAAGGRTRWRRRPARGLPCRR